MPQAKKEEREKESQAVFLSLGNIVPRSLQQQQSIEFEQNKAQCVFREKCFIVIIIII